ncbi:cytochrome P450 family 24 subfamily A member shade isoform X2 [Arctopsyche grandis]
MLPCIAENFLFWVLGAFTFLAQTCNKLLLNIPLSVKGKRNDIWKIPGPVYLPFVGTRWIFFWRYKMTKVHEAYRDMLKRYGNIVREVSPTGSCTVSIAGKADIEQVLRYPSRFPYRPPSDILYEYRRQRPDRFSSAGMAHENGEVWYDLRSKLTPELTSRKTMLGFLPELNMITDDFMQLLKNNRNANGEVKEFDQYAKRYGLETCCTLVLGQRMTFMENQISDTARKLSKAMNQRMQSERDSLYKFNLKQYMKTPEYTKFLDEEDVLYGIISDIVEKARNTTEDVYSDVKCILMSIVEKEGVDEREKKSALIDFVAAGIATLSNSLMFLFYLLSNHPEVQEKLCEEINNIAPNCNNITATDLSKMVYTKACMLEAFRMIPVAFALGRVLEEDMVLSGYHVPAGTFVFCHTMVACQNEENFTDAKSFKPERWVNENKECQAAAACIFAPFGIGRRMCPGKRFIEQAMLVTIAKMIREFHIEHDGTMDIEFQFVLAPKTPVTFRLKERC